MIINLVELVCLNIFEIIKEIILNRIDDKVGHYNTSMACNTSIFCRTFLLRNKGITMENKR